METVAGHDEARPYPLRPRDHHPRRLSLKAHMKERVRAVLVTQTNTLLLIKRTRPGVPWYWVLPGGGVEPTDASREAALHREIREELAGTAEIVSLLHVLGTADERHYIYLARITNWSFDERTGPEFTMPGRGEYALEEIPLSVAGLDRVALKPDAIAAFLRGALQSQGGLFAQPDLRRAAS